MGRLYINGKRQYTAKDKLKIWTITGVFFTFFLLFIREKGFNSILHGVLGNMNHLTMEGLVYNISLLVANFLADKLLYFPIALFTCILFAEIYEKWWLKIISFFLSLFPLMYLYKNFFHCLSDIVVKFPYMAYPKLSILIVYIGIVIGLFNIITGVRFKLVITTLFAGPIIIVGVASILNKYGGQGLIPIWIFFSTFFWYGVIGGIGHEAPVHKSRPHAHNIKLKREEKQGNFGHGIMKEMEKDRENRANRAYQINMATKSAEKILNDPSSSREKKKQASNNIKKMKSGWL